MAVMFHIDILKSVLNESSSWHGLVDHLRLLLPSSRSHVLMIIPDLLRGYFNALQQHKASLFPSSSVGVFNIVPRNAYSAGGDLGRLLMLLSDNQEDSVAWKARYELLLVAEQNIIQTGEYNDIWKNVIMQAQSCLQSCDSSKPMIATLTPCQHLIDDSPECGRFALLSLSCAAHTNYANIKAHLMPIFRVILLVRCLLVLYPSRLLSIARCRTP
jgi:hypothetical protein